MAAGLRRAPRNPEPLALFFPCKIINQDVLQNRQIGGGRGPGERSFTPASPVYPVREMKHSAPATLPVTKW